MSPRIPRALPAHVWFGLALVAVLAVVAGALLDPFGAARPTTSPGPGGSPTAQSSGLAALASAAATPTAATPSPTAPHSAASTRTPGPGRTAAPTAASTIAPTPGRTTPPATPPTRAPTPAPTATPRPATANAGSRSTVYMHYYLWWSTQHWHDKLGSAYPYAANPLPVPGTLGPDWCTAKVSYTGATIVNIPSEGLYDQGQASTFDRHIGMASSNGVAGFLADWIGTGSSSQTVSSSGYDTRLDLLNQRVNAWNTTHATRFRLGLAFDSMGDFSRPASAVINDLTYFADHYAASPAFANAYSSKPIVMWLDSRKYSLATVQAVSAAVRSKLYLLGDETSTSWPRDAAYLDGSSYYWSSESPANSGAGSQVASLGSQVHRAGKRWFAPFTPGFNSQLTGGSCVPRNGLATLDWTWSTNARSLPDAWFGISWNEFVENTYVEPSVSFGSTYLTEIKRLAGF